MKRTMKKFEMPKLEVIGLSANLACAGAKGGNFEFATKTTYKFGQNELTQAALSMESNADTIYNNLSGVES